jgi:hypothetical protein
MLLHRTQQIVAVVHGGHGLDLFVDEQPFQAGTKQNCVLGDHHPHAGPPGHE